MPEAWRNLNSTLYTLVRVYYGVVRLPRRVVAAVMSL